MEVPHHAHTARKKWTHYFWEFLMLFLAVYCGFLAENFREHQVEKRRGKQYVVSFYEDLKTDTVGLAFLIDLETKKIAALNELQLCYDSVTRGLSPSLFQIIRNSLSNNPFLRNERTLLQLSNAGGFRLLKKPDADSIISYQTAGNLIKDFQESLYQQAQDNVRNTFNEVVNFIPYTRLYSDVSIAPFPDIDTLKKPLFLTGEKILLNKYFNQLFQYLRVISQHRIQLVRMKNRADRLLLYFKTKYHLE